MRLAIMTLALLICVGAPATAQDMPADYKQVLVTLGKQGDFKDGVLKVNIPRSDLTVSVDGVSTPTLGCFTKTTRIFAPFSRARSCSSDSARSSNVGFHFTN